MIPIILKIILCSSLLVALYYLFLEKEKMHQFNRFYLIFSLVFSYVIPFITITTEFPKLNNNPQLIFEETAQQITLLPTKQESFNWMNVTWIVYGIVASILLLKAIISVLKIKNLKGKEINYLGQKIIITNQNLSPFSFWKTIYLGENYLLNNEIDSRIFLHEKSHLGQKHSIDLLLIEILKIITWFNPALYFYKKAMVTNHEFLADEYVLKNNYNIKDYQNLILQEIISGQHYNLTHTFNFNNTKKRFIMMNTKKTKLSRLKKIVSIPILITIFGLFVQKTYANNSNLNIKNNGREIQNTAPAEQSQLIKKEELNTKINVKENTNDEKVILDTIRPNKKNDAKISKKEKQKSTEYENDPPPPPPSVPYSKDFVTAEYPGGINSFRTKLASNFNGSVFDGKKGLIKSIVLLNLDENGKITQISATGDNTAFNNELTRAATAANNETLWKPATRNGKPEATVFKLPVTMTFE
ncbi:M56 family metallopeptidase [Chryseobacterium sp. SIMBA_038]|uniref:M56 family metallopeptidase n=1 Tax=Chryseobacterium sp. SIMBA_038 TaxID=3085780 RepID=UPI003977F0FF